MSVSDYNTDPDLNTTISGINIAEGCPPSGINNAIRQLMADVKTQVDTDGTTYLPLTGGTMTGQVVFSLASVIARDVNNSGLQLYGGNGQTNGAGIWIYGKDYSTYPGQFRIRANDGTTTDLVGRPGGALTWNSSNVVTESSGKAPTAIKLNGQVGSSGSSDTTVSCMCINGNSEASRVLPAGGTWVYVYTNGNNTFAVGTGAGGSAVAAKKILAFRVG